MRFTRKAQVTQKPRTGKPVAIRGFKAAETSRLLASWAYDGGFSAAEVSSALPTIRSRSRDLAKNSEHFKRWLDLNCTNIVGPDGFALKSTPHDGKPGSKEYRIDEAAAKFIEYHWWMFCTYRDPDTGLTYCDATGRKTDAEIDRLNVSTWKRDGEYFIHVIRNAPNPYGIAWRVLRPDWCAHDYNVTTHTNGNVIHCGVEMVEKTRRVVAYWFRTVPRDAVAYSSGGTPLIRIPVSDIIHGFTQHDEDQPRGIPEAYAVMQKLKMIAELDIAELTAAREDACVTRTYEAHDGPDPSQFVDLTDPDNQQQAQIYVQDKEAGQSIILPRGYTEKVNAPQHPNSQYAPFKDKLLADVASGFGVEYANFANNWAGVSFSSVRQGTISERDLWKIYQGDYISQCKTPQFLMWLKSFLSMPIGASLPIAKFAKFAEHEYRGRRWDWVDPMRDVKSMEIAVAHKWKTDTDVTSDLGGNYRDNVEQAARDKELEAGSKELTSTQLSSALQIVKDYAAGAIGKESATALLVASGVPSETAASMIGKQAVTKGQTA